MVERLARVMDPEYIPVWMYKPIPALDDEKPIDLLAGGDYRRLARLVSELESPTFSYIESRCAKKVAVCRTSLLFRTEAGRGGCRTSRSRKGKPGRSSANGKTA